VLLNLLNNASDAIEERVASQKEPAPDFERKIEIRAAYDDVGERIEISISDNGTGITKESMAKVFNLHFTTKRGGHGLGLYNCKTIAEQHGGDLTASSQVGKGTVFTLTLPRFQKNKVRK
jgi:signal transduction histidine kinase